MISVRASCACVLAMVALLALLSAAVVTAVPAGVVFGKLVAAGTGCANASLKNDGDTVSILLSSLSAVTGSAVGKTFLRTTCIMALPITVIPQGYSVQPSTVKIAAVTDAPAKSNGLLHAEVFIGSAGLTIDQPFSGPVKGNLAFSASNEVNDGSRLPCGKPAQLRLNLFVAMNSSATGANASVALNSVQFGLAWSHCDACSSKPCSPHASCSLASDGSAVCACLDGFIGDGFTCVRPLVNECATSNGGCAAGTVCQDLEDGFSCQDINECAISNGGCPANEVCTNTEGGFKCDCPTQAGAFQLDASGSCVDVNECATNNGGCSLDPPVACINMAGSFSCGTCPPHYKGDGLQCKVIECGGYPMTQVAGATCFNTVPRSCDVQCPVGFLPAGTQKIICPDTGVWPALSCTVANQCQTNNGGCSTNPLITCSMKGDAVVCGPCPSGYTQFAKKMCIDVNECATNNGGCDPGVTCFNVRGGYGCGSCPAGFHMVLVNNTTACVATANKSLLLGHH